MRIGVNFASVNSINDLNSGIGLFIKQLIDGLIENNAKELVILTSRKMHDYISSLCMTTYLHYINIIIFSSR